MMKISTAIGYSFKQDGARDHQEDSRFPDDNTSQSGQKFFVVCDGVGGSEKGEVASGIVASTIGDGHTLRQEIVVGITVLDSHDIIFVAQIGNILFQYNFHSVRPPNIILNNRQHKEAEPSGELS